MQIEMSKFFIESFKKLRAYEKLEMIVYLVVNKSNQKQWALRKTASSGSKCQSYLNVLI